MERPTTRSLLAGTAFGLGLGVVLPLVIHPRGDTGSTVLVSALLSALFLATALLWPRADPPPGPRAALNIQQPPARESDALVDIEVLAEPVLLIENLTILRANAAARAMFGERVVGGDVRVALRHPVILESIAQARELARPAVRELMGLGRQDNVFRLRAVAIEGGRALLAFADVTQARLTERMRVDFVANASHELRTPLATLLGFIETLQGPAADDEPARNRFLEIMAREAHRMSRLIDDLLSLSRIELDKYIHPRTPVDLAPVVADVARTLAVRLQSDGRELRRELTEPLPLVMADRDQMLQVLHNLISNAQKYGRSGTPIVIRAEPVPARPPRGEAMVKVSVIDEGEGIEAEHLPRLTERFYRVNTHRSRTMGGTGLGLAIVKHIIERHRGTLLIESLPGVGTTVSFTIPQAREEDLDLAELTTPELVADSDINV